MSKLDAFKKQFYKYNQLLSEKVTNAEGTQLDEEFSRMKEAVKAYDRLISETIRLTNVYLCQGNALKNLVGKVKQRRPGSGKDKSATMDDGSSMDNRGATLNSSMTALPGSSNTKQDFGTAEMNLANCFIKYGGRLPPNSKFAPAILSAGRTFGDVATVKRDMERNLRLSYLAYLRENHEIALKGVKADLKKLESQRLDYDYKRSKGNKMSEHEVKLAEEKFIMAQKKAGESMRAFLVKDIEHIQALKTFSEAQLEYHRRATSLFEQLLSDVDETYNDALDKREEVVNAWRVPQVTVGAPITPPQTNGGGSWSPATNTYPGTNYNKRSSTSFGPNVPSAKALYDFDAENSTELEFKEDDMIKLLERVDENWFFGELASGQAGYFPVNYVQVVVPLKDEISASTPVSPQ